MVRQEQCILSHKLIICLVDLKDGLNKRKMEFVKRCKVWKLRDEVTAQVFSKSECRPGLHWWWRSLRASKRCGRISSNV